MGSTAATAASDAAAAAGIGLFGLFQSMCCFGYLLWAAMICAAIVFWIVAIVDVAQRPEWAFPEAMSGRPSPNEKLIWVLVVILAGVLGAIIYYIVVMRKYPRQRPPR